ncbi:hypothetical protein [Streptomyces bacillaris]|uniref:hypothetical protein n=1 Tax=Streptomyces bacillaris TaxID=68179 RepID=UPI00363AE7C7
MLNAAEARIYGAAEDEAARERARANLYAAPRASTPRGEGEVRAAPPRAQMGMAQAQALMAQMAAEDSRLGGRGARQG